MSGIASAVVGGIIESDAAKSASKLQYKGTQLAIDEQRRQFDQVSKLLLPYTVVGYGALAGQAAMSGMLGPLPQKMIMKGIERSPQYKTAIEQSEEAILQNAAATGGIRGGNTQEALMENRQQLLAQQYNQKYGQLANLSGMGQQSTLGLAGAAQQTGANVSGLLQEQGAIQAGGRLAQGQAYSSAVDSLGTLAALKSLKVF